MGEIFQQTDGSVKKGRMTTMIGTGAPPSVNYRYQVFSQPFGINLYGNWKTYAVDETGASVREEKIHPRNDTGQVHSDYVNNAIKMLKT